MGWKRRQRARCRSASTGTCPSVSRRNFEVDRLSDHDRANDDCRDQREADPAEDLSTTVTAQSEHRRAGTADHSESGQKWVNPIQGPPDVDRVLAHTLKRMERDGLVRRLPDRLDGRRAIIWLTDRARQLEDTLTRSAREVNALTVSGFTDDEVSLCYHLVARMIGNLEAAATPDRARRRAQQGGRTC
jgi:hypothetical protein